MKNRSRSPVRRAPSTTADAVAENVSAVAEMHAAHRRRASSLQKLVASIAGRIGTPAALVFVVFAAAGWMLLNSVGAAYFVWRPDPPPFEGLRTFIEFSALCITLLILANQRRDDEISDDRAQLTLQLAILSEQKTAKIIELLEEIRREHPLLSNREDARAETLATPVDPQSVLDAVKESTAEAEAE